MRRLPSREEGRLLPSERRRLLSRNPVKGGEEKRWRHVRGCPST